MKTWLRELLSRRLPLVRRTAPPLAFAVELVGPIGLGRRAREDPVTSGGVLHYVSRGSEDSRLGQGGHGKGEHALCSPLPTPCDRVLGRGPEARSLEFGDSPMDYFCPCDDNEWPLIEFACTFRAPL